MAPETKNYIDGTTAGQKSSDQMDRLSQRIENNKQGLPDPHAKTHYNPSDYMPDDDDEEDGFDDEEDEEDGDGEFDE